VSSDKIGGTNDAPHEKAFRSLVQAAVGKIEDALTLVDQSDNLVAAAHLQAALDALSLSLMKRDHDND
jgi:hypothetical protein